MGDPMATEAAPARPTGPTREGRAVNVFTLTALFILGVLLLAVRRPDRARLG